jgi:NADPH:quinone reductase-like Zn-dependent oxidoreductase
MDDPRQLMDRLAAVQQPIDAAPERLLGGVIAKIHSAPQLSELRTGPMGVARRIAVGTRVAERPPAQNRTGQVVSQEAVVLLPDFLSFEEGATLPCAAATAWRALTDPTPVRAGHTVLMQGTGGVSIFALQLAKNLGARVISTTSSAAKAEKLLALGSDDVINYYECSRWGERV